MNKKFSTLMAGLLLAGGLTNLAFAEKLPYTDNIGKDFKSGDSYFLVNDLGASDGKWAYGFEQDPNNKDRVIEKVINLEKEDSFSGDDYKNYLWTVVETNIIKDATTPANDKYGYTLKNVGTGVQLIFNADGSVDTNTSDDADQLKDWRKYTVWFGESAGAYKTLTNSAAYIGHNYPSGGGHELVMYAKPELKASGKTAAGVSQTYMYFYGYEAQSQRAEELNELYNSIGFNMIVSAEKDQAAIKNLFATSGRVLALEVPEVNSPNKTTDGAAYPKGTYFVTSTPAGKTWAEICKLTGAEKNNAQYAFLEACTFIAVNSVENDINSKADREAGAGFQLTTVLGRDLQKYQGTEAAKQPTGRDIAVANACFSVKKNVSGDYAIGLETFWYNKVKAADIKDNDEQVSEADFWLNVTDKVGEDNDDKYLTTADETPHFIFSMKDLATTSVYSWLKNEKKMSVYNIQFVSDNDDINGKYLFVPAYGSRAYAKGVKFTDTNMPETQFVVTDVDADNNTVTFTNRANRGVSEAVKLYKESDGTYTMALPDDRNKDAKFYPLNVLNNGDIEAEEALLLHGLRVKITPVESVDYYYGAWNVDNGEEVTMLFARDNTPTSNKLYVKHPGTTSNSLNTSALKVTNEVGGALQFALKKSEKPVIKTYGYTYYLGETDKEQEKWEANGDTIAYYTYQLEAYYEGEPSGQYLTSTNNEFKLTSDETGAYHFIIKDNEDGSVQLISTDNSTEDIYGKEYALFVEDYEGTGISNNQSFIEYYTDKNIAAYEMTQEMKANYVKTYLNLESPEVSLDPKSTYVTFKAEEGDYITMKDDRDAVLVSDQPLTFRVFATDTEREVPNFLVSTGWNDNTKERMFLFNPKDSVNYLVAEGDYDKAYQWSEGINKAIFKSARMAESCDTLYTTIKGNATAVATVADQNKNVQGGLNYFKYQIIEDPENEGYYMIRQNGYFLTSTNGRMGFTKEQGARSLAVRVEVANVEAPTANEAISAGNVVVAGTNGAVVVKGAEGKNVIVTTILGKVVSNEVVSSDNAQIATPAGIVVVSVDGESFKVVVK